MGDVPVCPLLCPGLSCHGCCRLLMTIHHHSPQIADGKIPLCLDIKPGANSLNISSCLKHRAFHWNFCPRIEEENASLMTPRKSYVNDQLNYFIINYCCRQMAEELKISEWSFPRETDVPDIAAKNITNLPQIWHNNFSKWRIQAFTRLKN